MKERNVTVTLDKAKEWFNSNNDTLKALALQAFNEEELKFSYKDIKTIQDACKALNLSYPEIRYKIEEVAAISKASAAMFKLNIIRKALNLGYDLHLTENSKGQNGTWCPYFKIATKGSIIYNRQLERGDYEILGEIVSDGVTYNVIGGNVFCTIDCAGLGLYDSQNYCGSADTDFGFLGCAKKKIAKHFGKHFYMLIMEAMYGDMIDFEII